MRRTRRIERERQHVARLAQKNQADRATARRSRSRALAGATVVGLAHIEGIHPDKLSHDHQTMKALRPSMETTPDQKAGQVPALRSRQEP